MADKNLVVWSKIGISVAGESATIKKENANATVEVSDDLFSGNILEYATKIEEKIKELGKDGSDVVIWIFCPPAMLAVVSNYKEVFPERHNINVKLGI